MSKPSESMSGERYEIWVCRECGFWCQWNHEGAKTCVDCRTGMYRTEVVPADQYDSVRAERDAFILERDTGIHSDDYPLEPYPTRGEIDRAYHERDAALQEAHTERSRAETRRRSLKEVEANLEATDDERSRVQESSDEYHVRAINAEKERDAAKDVLEVEQKQRRTIEAERDTALARAERAEKQLQVRTVERDEARERADYELGRAEAFIVDRDEAQGVLRETIRLAKIERDEVETRLAERDKLLGEARVYLMPDRITHAAKERSLGKRIDAALKESESQ